MATPIDFQILYTQSSTIAQNLSGQQNAARLSEYSQQQINAQKNLENSKKVQQTEVERNTSSSVNENGRGDNPYTGYPNKKQKNPANKDNSENQDDLCDRVKEAHLGNIIDITR